MNNAVIRLQIRRLDRQTRPLADGYCRPEIPSSRSSSSTSRNARRPLLVRLLARTTRVLAEERHSNEAPQYQRSRSRLALSAGSTISLGQKPSEEGDNPS